MAWPANTTNIVTTNMDDSTDSPAAARADIKAALAEISNIINGRNQASGVAGIDASSKITNTQLPDTIISSSSTDLTLTPTTGTVNINSVLQMNLQTRVQLYARSDLADGMIGFCTTGDSTDMDAPVYYAGGIWRRFSDNSELPTS